MKTLVQAAGLKMLLLTWCMKGSSGTPPARGRSAAPPPGPAPCSLLSMLLV